MLHMSIDSAVLSNISQNFPLHMKKNLIQNAEIYIRAKDAKSILCGDRKERRLDQSKVDYRKINQTNGTKLFETYQRSLWE